MSSAHGPYGILIVHDMVEASVPVQALLDITFMLCRYNGLSQCTVSSRLPTKQAYNHSLSFSVRQFTGRRKCFVQIQEDCLLTRRSAQRRSQL